MRGCAVAGDSAGEGRVVAWWVRAEGSAASGGRQLHGRDNWICFIYFLIEGQAGAWEMKETVKKVPRVRQARRGAT